MEHRFSRRDLFQTSVGLYLASKAARAAAPPAPAPVPLPTGPKVAVGLVKGDNRIANIKSALELIDADIRRKLVGRKTVIIKPNFVSTNKQLAGAVTAVVSVVTVAAAFGVPREILVSLAPKSVTAGIAMAITESMGGRPALTAVLVIATGVMGAVIVTPLMNALKITDYAARGFAVGLASHGIGTARAFAVDEIAGTFAGIAMGLNGVATSLLVPLLLRWL